MDITFSSYFDWEDYAREYCELNLSDRIFEMPEQEKINTIIKNVLFHGFSDEYNIYVGDVKVSDELKAEVESGVRAYLTEQIESNVVPESVFKTIWNALDTISHDDWSTVHLKEGETYTKADLCDVLHDWLSHNKTY